MSTSRQQDTGRQPQEVGSALDELADLIIEIASDDERLSALAAKLSWIDMAQLGIPMTSTT